MRRPFALLVVVMLVVACGNSTPSGRPSPSVAAATPSPGPSPSPSLAVTLTCPTGPVLPTASPMSASTCATDEALILKGVAFLGYRVRNVVIFQSDCGVPFASGTAECMPVKDPQTVATVAFTGTDMLASVELMPNSRTGEFVAIVDVFEVPPSPAPATPPGASVYIDAGSSFAYSGDTVTISVHGALADIAGTPIPITATVDFGDGSTGTTAACADPASIDHTYQRGGQYQPTVTAVSLCGLPVTADLAGVSTSLLVFQSAPAASSRWPTCSTFQLALTGSSIPGDGGMGQMADRIALQNRSTTSCILEGDPGLQLVASDGRLLPTTVHPLTIGGYFFPGVHAGPSAAARRVALTPGASASFVLTYELNPSGLAANEPYTVACPTSTRVRVMLPGTHQYGTAALRMAACDGVLYVSPLVPGATGLNF